MSILNISWEVEQKVKISMRFLTFSIDFQFWTKRSRASRLSVLVIFEGKFGESPWEGGKVREGSAGVRKRSAAGREPDGGERGGTLPTFKEKKAQRDEVKGWEEWTVESEHENWK